MTELVRHWDPEERFAGAVLKVFEHWVLEVSWQQHTLGCYILFCRREGVRLISDLKIEELDDLKVAMGKIEFALRYRDPFRATHFNYLQLGNALPLLHFHGVPRYDGPRALSRELLNREVTDSNPGSLPAWSREQISHGQMQTLRQLMEKCMAENPFYKGIREAIDG